MKIETAPALAEPPTARVPELACRSAQHGSQAVLIDFTKAGMTANAKDLKKIGVGERFDPGELQFQ
jgi:hypothetical protein